jgi:hypothetical protein
MLLVVLGNRLFGSLPFTPLSTTLRPCPPLVNHFGSSMSQIRVGCTVREASADPTELEDTNPTVRPRPPPVEQDGQPLGRLRVESAREGEGPHLMGVLRTGNRPRALGSTGTARSAVKCHDGNASTRAVTIVGPSMTPPSDVPTRSTTPVTASARSSRAAARSASGRSRTPSNSVASHSRTQAL